jgi:hypothetical protein
MNRKTLVTMIGILVLASLMTACAPTEVVKTVEVEVEVTKVVTEIVEVTPEAVECEETPCECEETPCECEETPCECEEIPCEEATGFVALASLAEGIRAGEVEVGDEYGVGMGQRFHTIHAQTAGMVCTQCHVEEAPEEVAEAVEGSPGIVDRRVCLGCHLTGPATLLYESKE